MSGHLRLVYRLSYRTADRITGSKREHPPLFGKFFFFISNICSISRALCSSVISDRQIIEGIQNVKDVYQRDELLFLFYFFIFLWKCGNL